jgi:hypothetical protein
MRAAMQAPGFSPANQCFEVVSSLSQSFFAVRLKLFEDQGPVIDALGMQ